MTRHHWGADDPEVLPARKPDVGELPLFAEAPQPWPEAKPRGDAEQLVSPIGGTIQAEFEAWMQSEAGRAIYRAFCAEGLGQVARGATRLSAKGIWETIRARNKQSANNSFTALVARQAEQDYPTMRGLFAMRERRAS